MALSSNISSKESPNVSSKQNESHHPVAILGTGSFGAVIATLIAKNRKVYLYSRSEDRIKDIQSKKMLKGLPLHENIILCTDLEKLANECQTILPIIPSSGFRKVIRELSPYLKPYHILIHGTKGLDVKIKSGESLDQIEKLERHQVRTMSEVILEETVVVKVGCLAGPNISHEIGKGLPSGTVVASEFDEVIREGKLILSSPNFGVFSSKDLIGVELCGVLKNVIAIGAGALHGLNLGQNAFGLLISRGIVEMVEMGIAFGGNIQAFIGLAGIGDLVTTASSTKSRNFTLGYRFAKGETLEEISNSMEEVAEGYNTVLIMKKLYEHQSVKSPILDSIYKVIHQQISLEDAIKSLMSLRYDEDISFL